MLFAFLALTAVVLVALEVPLALSLARRERDVRATAAQRDAAALAALSDEAVEHPEGHNLVALTARYTDHTDMNVVIVDASGRPLAVAPTDGDEVEPSYSNEVSAALAGRPASGRHHDDGGTRRFVATPIGSATAIHGAVLITYPAAPIEGRVHRMWAGLAALGALVLLIAGVLGVVVARSVTRPLSRLQQTAAALGRGDLDARSGERVGPPELQALSQTFDDMAGRLAGLVDAQRRFVADASHQLRSPLTALRLRLEGMDADDPRNRRDLEAALREVHRLSRLVDGLLALARVEGSRVDRQAVDVAEVADERRTAWGPLAEERGVALEVCVESERPVMAMAVPGSLDQVLDNLLANALDVSPTGTAVTITVRHTSAGVELQVADQGPGMAVDDRV
ncbi:MAG: two-component system sensor kinase, partial [Acidimicrobiales bacterium]|nr:two-component system sensor kinase [Acidimicrobiales bacterium]